MNKFIVTEESLTNIADAIRNKTGSSEPLAYPDDFIDGISGIETLEKVEYTYSIPAQETEIKPNELVLLGQISMGNRARAILDVFPVSGYDSTQFQFYYLFQSSEEQVYSVKFMLYNKSSDYGAVFSKNAMSVKVISYK